jgi:hypothetical protein
MKAALVLGIIASATLAIYLIKFIIFIVKKLAQK